MSFVPVHRRQFTLEVTTTALCNLACTYCFEGEKVNKQRLDDKVDLIKQRIHELLDSGWFVENYDVLNISFWGGEPTLNGPLIVDVMNEFASDGRVDYHIYTNGYDRRRLESIVDLVDCSRLHIQISYDGQIVNDKFRLTATGKTTSSQVIDNLLYFAKKGISISLKSTVPTTSMVGMYMTWLEFKRLHDAMRQYPNVRVTYSPTIDYTTNVTPEDIARLVGEFRAEVLRIAADEIKFVREHGYHLMSWFNGSDSKSHCSAGAHMHTLDVDGQTYACHGTLYSPNKDQLRGGTILDDTFVDDVIAMSNKFQGHIKETSPVCVDCVATTCMICPAASFDKSKEEDFTAKWTDRWVNSMCGFFKTFGEIDRTVQAHLSGELELNTPNKGDAHGM